MTENRKFLTPLSELIDRLTVDQIKQLLNKDDSQESLKKEMQNIMYDIDQIINDKKTKLDSEIIRMIIILSQINLHIWNLKDRMEKDKNGYDKNLKLAHQINGIRNQIKNSNSNIELIDENKFIELSKNIKDFDIIYPCVGENMSFLKKIIKINNLITNYLVKKEDKFCWQFSNKGYFNFKSNIPKILSQLSLN